ncbi:hypothetical protein M0P65_03585 [Candidatus Gracilibacteria bacterium]|nr:hypothetical protein [Candidatus Gracilibacteria bacterium]
MINIDLEAFKNAGFSFDEIQSITEGEKNIRDGDIMSEEEMKSFIKTELFSKYSINA